MSLHRVESCLIVGPGGPDGVMEIHLCPTSDTGVQILVRTQLENNLIWYI